jgi:hypothetical protein
MKTYVAEIDGRGIFAFRADTWLARKPGSTSTP